MSFICCKEYNRICEKEIKDAKIQNERQIAKDSRTNPQKFFKYINSKKVRSEYVGPLQNNLEWVTGDKEKANLLNTFFSSLYTKEHGGAHVHNGGCSDTASNDPQWLKSDMVQKYLDRIKVDKAPGPDDIHHGS